MSKVEQIEGDFSEVMKVLDEEPKKIIMKKIQWFETEKLSLQQEIINMVGVINHLLSNIKSIETSTKNCELAVAILQKKAKENQLLI